MSLLKFRFRFSFHEILSSSRIYFDVIKIDTRKQDLKEYLERGYNISF